MAEAEVEGLGRVLQMGVPLATTAFDEVICDSDRYGGDLPGDSARDRSPLLTAPTLARVRMRPCWGDLVSSLENTTLSSDRLIPDNNADLIVEGFRRTDIGRKLVILGDVPYRDAYASKIRQVQDSRLLFPGYVKSQSVLKELYCNAYAYLHGHEFGGTNPALLKALAYGSCVVALDTVFSQRGPERRGVRALFQKDPADVLQVFEGVDRDPVSRKASGTSHRRRIFERYTWERITSTV